MAFYLCNGGNVDNLTSTDYDWTATFEVDVTVVQSEHQATWGWSEKARFSATRTVKATCRNGSISYEGVGSTSLISGIRVSDGDFWGGKDMYAEDVYIDRVRLISAEML